MELVVLLGAESDIQMAFNRFDLRTMGGDFKFARQYATRGLQIWRSGNVQCFPEDLHAPIVRIESTNARMPSGILICELQLLKEL
jgi:hypothetical protein